MILISSDPQNITYDIPHHTYNSIEIWENISYKKKIIIPENTHINILYIIKNSSVEIEFEYIHQKNSAHISCLIIGNKNTTNSVTIQWKIKNNQNHCLIETIALLDENSVNTIQAWINIDKNTVWNNGNVSQENIILWKKISLKTLPLLDVHTNDVKASHWATIQQLDKNKIFYLEAKGLSENQAKKLMVESYIHKSFEHLKETENHSDEIQEIQDNLLKSLIL